MKDQFLGEELRPEENRADSARFQVIPCGLEATVSYGTGTADGASAIIAASHQLERLIDNHEHYHEHYHEPCAQGIYTHAPINCDQPIEQVMADLRTLTHKIARHAQIPVVLGGEHSLTYGAVMGVVDAFDAPIGLVHIDAHADFRNAYQGQKHSHASVMHLLAAEGLPMVSLGVRALSAEEASARAAHGVICHDAGDLVRNNTHSIDLPDDFPKNIYVSFDVDGLDPAIVPATGTPVPGGLGFYQALDLIKSTLRGRQCVGFDIVELAPIANQPMSDFTVARIAYHLMGFALK